MQVFIHYLHDTKFLEYLLVYIYVLYIEKNLQILKYKIYKYVFNKERDQI